MTKVLVVTIIRTPIALIMEAARTSEMSVNFYQTTRRNNPDDSNLLITGQNSSSETISAVGDSDNEDVDISGCNTGWADAMSRVLRSKKPRKSRSVVLSRAKKLNDAAKTVKEEDTELEVGDIKPRISSLNEQRSRRKQEQKSKCRVKPNILDHDYERRLNRIATRGVVQLFNAVRQQQKSLEGQLKEAGSSERKRDKVMKSLDKRAFIDILLGSSRSEPVDSPVKLEAEIKREEEEEQYNTWHVLRDDFMLGTARLKDWDKTDAPT